MAFLRRRHHFLQFAQEARSVCWGTATATPSCSALAHRGSPFAQEARSHCWGTFTASRSRSAMEHHLPSVHMSRPDYRMIASTKCSFGNSALVTTIQKDQSPKIFARSISTDQKVSLKLVDNESNTRFMKSKDIVKKTLLRWWISFWKSMEEDFVKSLGKLVLVGFVISFLWLAYTVMLALGMDVGPLDKIRRHVTVRERAVSQENMIALSSLADLLELKDRRLEESEYARQAYMEKIEDLEEKMEDLEEEVINLKALIHTLQEQVSEKVLLAVAVALAVTCECLCWSMVSE